MKNWSLEIWLIVTISAFLLGAILTWLLTRLNSEIEVKCEWCGSKFTIRRKELNHNIRNGLGNYCSDKCRRIVMMRRNGSFT
ncbi:MAG: hypothetical protein AMS27_07325 [Bacteroides sp. SM23_62_1]|nr:MAG: hypothetical protein AMS27_07325 [Bacteroides sp. SM23_62_1]